MTTITTSTISSLSPSKPTGAGQIQPRFSRTLRKSSNFGPSSSTRGIVTASTPNLNLLYSTHGSGAGSGGRLVAPALSRKGSLATLTQSSLASIPDVSESYALDSVLNDSPTIGNMAPLTPGKLGDDVAVGDTVDVPGNMHGVVRFVGSVQGKKGVFAGVELHGNFASRGKNNGDVDGVSYFNTSVPGAGIFLPVSKAARRDSPTTPTPGGLKAGTQNSTNFTPPTPSLPKLSQSVGPGGAASPTGRRPPRPSLPRPESPMRRLQMTPASRPSMATPGKVSSGRYVSPTVNRFTQSVRGTAGDPSKRAPTKMERKPSFGPRSASALSQRSQRNGFDDDETTPTALKRTKTNGSVGSVSSLGMKMGPPSRANNDDEVDRLRNLLEDRERQLKEQASSLAEMESSFGELQSLMDHPDGLRLRRGSIDDKDSSQLRALLREKNEKIAMLTSEFDAHRADFRSTIDALEMASTETVRVYEAQKKDMVQELQELSSRLDDVDSVATQLKQMEELVQELEEGLEDARRGEAEARGEVEFLRGEVERTRSELRREREKGSSNGHGLSMNGSLDKSGTSKDLEQKEDEIRGLKAIIHSLSRDSGPPDSGKLHSDSPSGQTQLERQLAELQRILEEKNNREGELEREVEMLRKGGVGASTGHRQSSMTIGSNRRSSLRDSRDTVILARAQEPRSPEAGGHKRGRTLDTMPESDTYSTATENSTLWCEICETGGHDILTCTNMFGPDGNGSGSGGKTTNGEADKAAADKEGPPLPDEDKDDVKPAPLSPVKNKYPPSPSPVKILPNPMESGPVAGKDSGIVDESKWCAICERDGHDSVDCPFEDAF